MINLVLMLSSIGFNTCLLSVYKSNHTGLMVLDCTLTLHSHTKKIQIITD